MSFRTRAAQISSARLRRRTRVPLLGDNTDFLEAVPAGWAFDSDLEQLLRKAGLPKNSDAFRQLDVKEPLLNR